MKSHRGVSERFGKGRVNPPTGKKDPARKRRKKAATRPPLRFQRRPAVPPLFPPPKATHQRAMIERECEYATRCDQASGGTQCVTHGSGVMQHPPSIDHVEQAETSHILGIQDQALLDRPFAVTGEIAVAQSCGTEYGIRVKIERMHARSEFASGERK